MTDSLLLDGVIELLNPAAVSAIPGCVGAVFHLGGFAEDYSLGSPLPVVASTATLLLDGERPFGRRASNRDVSLPVYIDAPDLPTLVAAREALFQVVDQQTWTMQWTRDGGQPLLFDCFRAAQSAVTYSLTDSDSLICRLGLSFQALPYARSATLQTLNFASPAQGGTLPPTAVTVDNYSTVSTTTQTTSGWWTKDTSNFVTGSASARWNWWVTDQDSCPFYSHTLGATVDITGRTKLSFWFGLGSPPLNYDQWHKGNVTFAITLVDNAGSPHTLSFGGQVYCYSSNGTANPRWNQVTFAIPQGQAGFDYTHVAKYSVKAWRFIDNDGDLELDASSFLNGLTAYAPTTGTPATTRGTVYQLLGILGSARTPLALQFQQPATAIKSNTAEGGTDGVTVTTGNSGAASGLAWDTVSIGASCTAAFTASEHDNHGNLAYALVSSSGSNAVYVQWTLAALTAVYARVFIKLPAYPAVTDNLIRFADGLNNTLCRLAVSSTGIMTLINSAGATVATFTNAITSGAWSRVEINATFPGGATAAYEVRLFNGTSGDGATATEIKSGSGQTFGAAAAAQVRFGWSQAVASNQTMYLDDIAIATSGFLGAMGLPAFKTLIAHRPGADQPAELVPITGVGNGADTPNGGTEYPVAAYSTGVNARFDGTYTVILTNFTWHTGANARLITVTFKQYEYPGGPSASVSVTRTVTPNTDITNGIVVVDNVSLPVREIPSDNTQSYTVITITSGDTADRFLDVLLIDTEGQLAMINVPSGSGYVNYWLDRPDANNDLGLLSASTFDRPSAVSILSYAGVPSAVMSGGPLTADPGDNPLLVYAVEGQPSLIATYAPYYWVDLPGTGTGV